jgi:sugar phosphate isomerase/epimerase
MSPWPIGVFSSIDAGLGVRWDVIKQLKVPTIQLHAPQPQSRTIESATRFASQLRAMNVELTCVFGGFAGESYADIPTVVRTVGLVPLATRAARFREMCEIANFARQLDCRVVGLHLGFVPEDHKDEAYPGIVEITRQLCDHCDKLGQSVHLETGQETADGLLQFIESVGKSNLKINFDPANMILYGTGEPLEALRKVGQYVGSVHCKDGTWSDQPGKTWGCEVPLGEGDVNMRKYLETLRDIGYLGPLTIEREIPEEPERQLREIGGAVNLLSTLKREILGVSV